MLSNEVEGEGVGLLVLAQHVQARDGDGAPQQPRLALGAHAKLEVGHLGEEEV